MLKNCVYCSFVFVVVFVFSYIFLKLEVLAMVNILQLLFLGVQLDGIVSWSWAVSVQYNLTALQM